MHPAKVFRIYWYVHKSKSKATHLLHYQLYYLSCRWQVAQRHQAVVSDPPHAHLRDDSVASVWNQRPCCTEDTSFDFPLTKHQHICSGMLEENTSP